MRSLIILRRPPSPNRAHDKHEAYETELDNQYVKSLINRAEDDLTLKLIATLHFDNAFFFFFKFCSREHHPDVTGN